MIYEVRRKVYSGEILDGKRSSIRRGINSKIESWKFFGEDEGLPSLKLTFSHLKMDGWKTTFLLMRHIFRCKLLVLGRVTWWVFNWVQIVNLRFQDGFFSTLNDEQRVARRYLDVPLEVIGSKVIGSVG